jgi:phage-related protein
MRTKIGTFLFMNRVKPLTVKFYRTQAGHEPVREWLRSLGREDKKTIGEDIKTVQYGWPLGMPLVRKLEPDLWEIRISLDARIARILLTVKAKMVILLHGFIKKSQRTPAPDLSMARRRRNTL